MAIPATAVWEVRPSGSDASGGCYDPVIGGAAGATDWTQRDTPIATYNDLACAGATAVVTSVQALFTAAMVGNGMSISGGTGFTAGIYVIASYQSSTQVTLDRAPAAGAASGATWAIGGGLGTPGYCAGKKVAGNDVWIKNGTYSVTSTTQNITQGAVYDNTGGVDRTNYSNWRGYNTARWDPTVGPTASDLANRPTIAAAGVTSSFTLVKLGLNSVGYITFDNITVDGASKASTLGIDFSGYYSQVIRCKITNCTNQGIDLYNANLQSVLLCEVSNITGGNFAINAGYGGSAYTLIYGCEVRDCTVSIAGIGIGYGCTVLGNLIYGNSTDGISGNGAYGALMVAGNTCYGNGRYGFNLGKTVSANSAVINNIAYNNTSGQFYSGTVVDDIIGFNNAGALSTVGNFPKFQGQIALTGDPFVDAVTTKNFALNPSGANYAALKAGGILGKFPRGVTTSYSDIGAAQHQDAGGGGGILYLAGMQGGMQG